MSKLWPSWRTKTIDITWPRSEGHAGMTKALEHICAAAEAAIGLAILVGLYRTRQTVNLDDASLMRR